MRMALNSGKSRTIARELGFLHENKSDLDINKFVKYLYNLQRQLDIIETSITMIQTIEMEHINNALKRKSTENNRKTISMA